MLSFARHVNKCKHVSVKCSDLFLPYFYHGMNMFYIFVPLSFDVYDCTVTKSSVPPNTMKPSYIKSISYHKLKPNTAQHYYDLCKSEWPVLQRSSRLHYKALRLKHYTIWSMEGPSQCYSVFIGNHQMTSYSAFSDTTQQQTMYVFLS